jgi:hypothetical protein
MNDALVTVALAGALPFVLGAFLIGAAALVAWSRGARERALVMGVLAALAPLPFPVGIAMLFATNATWMPLVGLGVAAMNGGLVVVAGVSERVAPVLLSVYGMVTVPLLGIVFAVWASFGDNWLFASGSAGVFVMGGAVLLVVLWGSLAPGGIALGVQLYEQRLEREAE